MHTRAVTTEEQVARSTTPDLFRRFLEAYWLRPENALWMTIRSQTLAGCPLEHPVADLSCGDGVFSFLHAGGAFDADFDVFRTVQSVEEDRSDHADMFDYADADYRPGIALPPANTIDVGTDWKAALLFKARCLDFYGRLVRTDHNLPLPFEADSFQTIYCNAAYWVEQIAGFLGELGRITRPGGRIILQVKLDTIRQCTLQRHRDVLGDRFLQIIDRGRIGSWPTLASRTTWEQRFKRAGLVVEEATAFITATHAHVWDIGLRPIAPILVRMASGLNTSTRASIKRDWVDAFHDLLTPFCRPDFSLNPPLDTPVEVQYVLTPRCPF